MGLLNKLQNGDANEQSFNGATPPTSVGATDQSTLHANGLVDPTQPGYSLNGNPNQISDQQPSILDLNGQTPTFAGHGISNGSSQQLPYINNEPG